MSRAFEGLKNVATIAIGVIVRDLANKFGRAIGESVELASKMDTLQQSFNRLKAASGAAGLSLEKLRKATRGTVADVDLLQSANLALAMGIPVDKLDQLYAAAMKLGAAMGITATQAIENVCTGISRQSRLILDNLGIVFSAEEAYLPALISNIKGVGSAFTALFNLLMAHPIFLVIAAIAALIMILIHAYQTCEPFRNAVNALGQILLNVFKAAIDAVTAAFQLLLGAINFIVGAFKWLWDTITRNPLVALLLGPLTMLVWLFNNWDRVVKAVTGALRWLWNILRPVADLIGAVANALGSVVGWLFGSPKTIFEDAALGVRKLKRELRGLHFPAFPAGFEPAGGGGTVVNVRVDAQGAVFADDYDVDRFMDRVVWRLRREVG